MKMQKEVSKEYKGRKKEKIGGARERNDAYLMYILLSSPSPYIPLGPLRKLFALAMNDFK